MEMTDSACGRILFSFFRVIIPIAQSIVNAKSQKEAKIEKQGLLF